MGGHRGARILNGGAWPPLEPPLVFLSVFSAVFGEIIKRVHYGVYGDVLAVLRLRLVVPVPYRLLQGFSCSKEDEVF